MSTHTDRFLDGCHDDTVRLIVERIEIRNRLFKKSVHLLDPHIEWCRRSLDDGFGDAPSLFETLVERQVHDVFTLDEHRVVNYKSRLLVLELHEFSVEQSVPWDSDLHGFDLERAVHDKSALG
jgi:hypothetical protein